MLSELSIIKAFLTHETWEQYNTYITISDFPEDLKLLYRVLDSFHKINETKDNLVINDLANLLYSNPVKDKEFYEEVLNNLASYEPNLSTIKTLLVSLKKTKLLREISIASYEVAEGKKEYEHIDKLLKALSVEEETQEEGPLVTDDLETLVNKVYLSPGLRWRLDTLNKMLGSLRQGNFGYIQARPETGKTTFLASEVSFMAQQLKEDECVLFINNEEVHENVKIRIYQATFGATLEQLMSSMPEFNEAYKKQIGSKIKMSSASTFSRYDIERLCKLYKPKLIVVDQLPKITGFKADREDLLLGDIFQWARELAKQYGPVIGVCQADASGENQKWLGMNNAANSKTAISAEADWILGIGKIHDPGWEKIRFFHLAKNKLTGDPDTDPTLRHGKKEVLISPMIARYEDITL